jgi:DNA-binding protein
MDNYEYLTMWSTPFRDNDDLDYVAAVMEHKIFNVLGEKVIIKPTFKDISKAVDVYGIKIKAQIDLNIEKSKVLREEKNKLNSVESEPVTSPTLLDKIFIFFGGK